MSLYGLVMLLKTPIMTQQFNIRRIGNFIYRDIVLLRNTIITTLSVVGVLLLFFFLYDLRGDHIISEEEFASNFMKFYVVLGILFTFSIFREAHHKKSNLFYFSLPISSYERVTAIWLTTSALYTLLFSVFGFLIGQVAIVLGSMFSETNFHLLPIFSENYWQGVTFYFFIQPTFLLGAILFTKNRIIKTLLFVVLLVFGLFIFNGILFSIFNIGYDIFSEDQIVSNAFSLAREDFSGIGIFLFVIIMVPVMLLAAYFKIIEKEV